MPGLFSSDSSSNYDEFISKVSYIYVQKKETAQNLSLSRNLNASHKFVF